MSLAHRADTLVIASVFIFVLMALVMIKVYLIGLEKYEAKEVPPQTIEQKKSTALILIRAAVYGGIFIFIALVMIHIYKTLPYLKK